MSRLPEFLIIGAMKAGTTSLYRDLASHREIFLPEEKEPEALSSDAVLTPAGRRAYERLFCEAADSQICGEASTGYTKAPTVTGVPARAAQILGPDVKLIYMVRHPVARAVSHHRYLYQFDLMPAGFEQTLDRDSSLLDYSRYAMQLKPWLSEFSRQQILVLPFEAYVANRSSAVAAVCRFLEVDPAAVTIRPQQIANRTEGMRPLRGIWRRLAMNPLYQRGVRPLLPIRGRTKLPWLRRLLAGPPKPPLEPVSEATQRRLWKALVTDIEEFHQLLGADAWLWDASGPTAENCVGSPTFASFTQHRSGTHH